MDNINYYKSLITHVIPLRELLKNPKFFSEAPSDWHVIVAEVKKPLIGINQGLHNDINLVTTGSIITVLNTIKSIDKNLKTPYFFRGDGATFVVPPSVLDPLVEALENYSIHIQKTLNLTLKYGHLKVDDIYKNGRSLRFAKLKLNTYLITPVVLGNGLKYAEHSIKTNFQENTSSRVKEAPINLEGMECRWDEIYPDQDEEKVICLLVFCKAETDQAVVFTKIMDEIDYIFGDLNTRSPIKMVRLRLDNTIRKMRKEMYVRLGKLDRSYLVQNWLITYFGTFYFKFFKGGKHYLYKVTQLSDTIMLDGAINTVFSGTQHQISKLKMLLDAMEADELILFGMHSTYASIMSCYVEDREENHIHFVDGTEGGYISAAVKLNDKITMSEKQIW